MKVDRPVGESDVKRAEKDFGRAAPAAAAWRLLEDERHLHAFVTRTGMQLATALRKLRVGPAALTVVRDALTRTVVITADAVKHSRDFRQLVESDSGTADGKPTRCRARKGPPGAAGEVLMVDRVVFLGLISGTAGPAHVPLIGVSIERAGDVIDQLGFVQADALLLAESLTKVLNAGEGCPGGRRELEALTEPAAPRRLPGKPLRQSADAAASRACEAQTRRLRQVRVEAALAVLKRAEPELTRQLRQDMTLATGGLADAGVSPEVAEGVLGEVLRTAARALSMLRHEYRTACVAVAGDQGLAELDAALRRLRSERRQDLNGNEASE